MTTAIYAPIVSPYRASDVKQIARVTSEDIITFICHYKQIPAEEIIRQPKGKREVVHARQLCMYYIRQRTELSLNSIGERFGGRDHTTVIHAVRTIKDLLQVNDEVVKRDIEYLNDVL